MLYLPKISNVCIEAELILVDEKTLKMNNMSRQSPLGVRTFLAIGVLIE